MILNCEHREIFNDILLLRLKNIYFFYICTYLATSHQYRMISHSYASPKTMPHFLHTVHTPLQNLRCHRPRRKIGNRIIDSKVVLTLKDQSLSNTNIIWVSNYNFSLGIIFAKQFNFGFATLRLHSIQLRYVLIVHSKDPVERFKVIFGDLKKQQSVSKLCSSFKPLKISVLYIYITSICILFILYLYFTPLKIHA